MPIAKPPRRPTTTTFFVVALLVGSVIYLGYVVASWEHFDSDTTTPILRVVLALIVLIGTLASLHYNRANLFVKADIDRDQTRQIAEDKNHDATYRSLSSTATAMLRVLHIPMQKGDWPYNDYKKMQKAASEVSNDQRYVDESTWKAWVKFWQEYTNLEDLITDEMSEEDIRTLWRGQSPGTGYTNKLTKLLRELNNEIDKHLPTPPD